MFHVILRARTRIVVSEGTIPQMPTKVTAPQSRKAVHSSRRLENRTVSAVDGKPCRLKWWQHKQWLASTAFCQLSCPILGLQKLTQCQGREKQTDFLGHGTWVSWVDLRSRAGACFHCLLVSCFLGEKGLLSSFFMLPDTRSVTGKAYIFKIFLLAFNNLIYLRCKCVPEVHINFLD